MVATMTARMVADTVMAAEARLPDLPGRPVRKTIIPIVRQPGRPVRHRYTGANAVMVDISTGTETAKPANDRQAQNPLFLRRNFWSSSHHLGTVRHLPALVGGKEEPHV